MNDLKLSGHTALVTGGGQGIGKEIALLLLEHGANVISADINQDALDDFSRITSSKGFGSSFAGINIDVSKVDDLERAAKDGEERYGGIDVLINNAGVLHSTCIEDITEMEWDRIMNINLKSYFFAVQKVLPCMKKKHWGRIVNISSLAGRMGGYANGLAYSASKAGIIGLSRGLAYRLAKHNITVNCIAPGTTESAIINQFPEEKIQELRNMIPIGRLGKPIDIARLVLFLASDMAEYITGSTIDINGGMYMA